MPEIYLLATNTKKPISHIITAYTGERFNHASVAFDRSLAECYSYSMAENGFVRETKETWPGWTTFELYAAQVTSAGFARARELVRNLSRERPDFSYRGVLGVAVEFRWNPTRPSSAPSSSRRSASRPGSPACFRTPPSPRHYELVRARVPGWWPRA